MSGCLFGRVLATAVNLAKRAGKIAREVRLSNDLQIIEKVCRTSRVSRFRKSIIRETNCFRGIHQLERMTIICEVCHFNLNQCVSKMESNFHALGSWILEKVVETAFEKF